MTTTETHAERAGRLLQPDGLVPGLDAIPETRVAIAQVEATLALVEQQRRVADLLERWVVVNR